MTARSNIPAPDRITAPPISANDAAWRSAVQPYDTAVARIENLWGSVARLVRHATPETAAKFGRAVFAMNDALERAARDECEPADVARFTGAVVRGLAVLEAEAGDPTPTRFMAYREPGDGGRHLIIAEREDDGMRLAAEFPGATIFSLPEIARVITAYDKTLLATLLAAKAEFPVATLWDVRPAAKWSELNDEIPF